MNGNASTAAGDTTDDDSDDGNTPPSSANESVNGAVRREDDDEDEEEESDEEDDGEEEENGNGIGIGSGNGIGDGDGIGDGEGYGEVNADEEVDIVTVDQEITDAEMEIEEEKDVSMEETSQSEFSSSSAAASSSAVAAAAAVDQDSSEFHGEEERTESQISHSIPPNFPLEFTKRIVDPQSVRPRILMEKKLRESDVDENRNRLSIPAKEVKEAFLLLEEEDRLSAGEDMEVQLIEPDGGAVSAVTLRRRRIGENQAPSYALTGEWSEVVARNSDALKRGRKVRVWYFRDDDRGGGLRLCFAIEVFEEGKEGDSEVVKELTQKWWGQNIFAP